MATWSNGSFDLSPGDIATPQCLGRGLERTLPELGEQEEPGAMRDTGPPGGAGEDLTAVLGLAAETMDQADLALRPLSEMPRVEDPARELGIADASDWEAGQECTPYTHHWDASTFDGYGDPIREAEFWRLQNGNSCAVNAQLCIIESLTGQCLTEAAACQLAEQCGWYDPWSGTPLEHMDKLLEHAGVETTVTPGADILDIAEALERGDRVIVALDAYEIWYPLRDAETGAVVSQTGSAGHAVCVTGIDQAEDGTWTVIMNDTGTPDGRMRAVALEDFLEAWNDYNNHLVVAHA